MLFCSVNAQEVSGLWQTVDDRTGEAKAIIRLYTKDDMLYGEIEQILVEDKKNALCVKCPGGKKNKPILGMKILNGLKRVGPNEWEGNSRSLFDPEQGRSYRSRVWINPGSPDILNVRGYWMFIHRTQRWKRKNE